MTQKQLYDRKSLEDARIVFEELVPNLDTRTKLAEFMLDAVQYAERQKPGNWNINLDPYGKFIRMNVGSLYCIQIDKEQILILCDRNIIKTYFDRKNYHILFQGYRGFRKNEPVRSSNLKDVPDCLVRVRDSVACLLSTSQAALYIDSLKKGNFAFIGAANRTDLRDNMRSAHSPGVIDYLNSISSIYSSFEDRTRPIVQDPPLLKDELEKQEERVKQSRLLTDEARKERLKQAQRYPAQKAAVVIVFDRNEDVIVEVLRRANGRCERCGHHAPFVKDRDGSAYLEVHHRKPLSEQGEDTVENAIALCPNCHRHAHYGKASFSWTERASCSCSPLRPPHR